MRRRHPDPLDSGLQISIILFVAAVVFLVGIKTHEFRWLSLANEYIKEECLR